MTVAAEAAEASTSVHLELPADRSFLLVARSAAAAVAARAGFAVDGIEDVRLGVWEAGALLTGLAAPGAVLTFDFLASLGQVHASVSAPTPRGIRLHSADSPEIAYAWALIGCLMDEATTEWDPASGTSTITMRLNGGPAVPRGVEVSPGG